MDEEVEVAAVVVEVAKEAVAFVEMTMKEEIHLAVEIQTGLARIVVADVEVVEEAVEAVVEIVQIVKAAKISETMKNRKSPRNFTCQTK